jgi:hypothetical protein
MLGATIAGLLPVVLPPMAGRADEPVPPAESPKTPASPAADGTIDLWKKSIRVREDYLAKVERTTIYRADFLRGKLVPVAIKECKPDHVYLRPLPGSGRHVWSLATADGGFRHQLGPGTVQLAQRFDPRATPEERKRALESAAPDAARLLAIQGAQPTARLDAAGHWQLSPVPTVTSIFDLETGCRWEWHGPQPSGVVHGGGNRWKYVGDRYRPAGRF